VNQLSAISVDQNTAIFKNITPITICCSHSRTDKAFH